MNEIMFGMSEEKRKERKQKEEQKIAEETKLIHSEISVNIRDYRDKETGVHYLIFEGYRCGGICPRYNTDGSLYID